MAGDTSTLITLKKFLTECNFNKRDQSIFIASVEENFTGGIILFSGGEQRGDQILQTQYKEFRGRTIISFFCKLTYLIINVSLSVAYAHLARPKTNIEPQRFS